MNVASSAYRTFTFFSSRRRHTSCALVLEFNVCSSDLIGLGRKLGLDTVGFLMMAHMTSVETLVEQALLMEGYGATTVYCVDSAGYMLPEEVTARIGALRGALQAETAIGLHGHHQLGLGIAN